MTRKEQIIEASTNWANKEYEAGEKIINSLVLTDDEKAEAQNDLSINTENERQAFQEGARWADRTMIENACDWLYEYNRKQADKMFGTVHTADVTINVADFRKAMQEGDEE